MKTTSNDEAEKIYNSMEQVKKRKR